MNFTGIILGISNQKLFPINAAGFHDFGGISERKVSKFYRLAHQTFAILSMRSEFKSLNTEKMLIYY